MKYGRKIKMTNPGNTQKQAHAMAPKWGHERCHFLTAVKRQLEKFENAFLAEKQSSKQNRLFSNVIIADCNRERNVKSEKLKLIKRS